MYKIKHLGLKIDSETLRKFKYIVEFHGKSMNGMLMGLIHQDIAKHEHENGKIK